MPSENMKMLDECSKLMVEELTGWKPPETTTVKMDGRHKHIQMLLQWDKMPRGPLPYFPKYPLSTLFAKVQREDYERVLAQYKRVGYAYAEVKDVDAEEYGDVDEQDPEYEEARLRKKELKELGPLMESLVKDSVTKLAGMTTVTGSGEALTIQSKESEEKAKSGEAVTKLANPGSSKRKRKGKGKGKGKRNRVPRDGARP